MPPPEPLELASYLHAAAGILDDATEQFVAGHRAASAVAKAGNDFATEVDLALERQIAAALTRQTGIEVHGEEFGGAPLDSELVWVLDPIDGTFNYAAGSPVAAMLLALLWRGIPALGFTWIPFTGHRYYGMPPSIICLHDKQLPQLTPSTLNESMVGIGTFNIASRGEFPGRYRAEVLSALSTRCSRVRMHGSTGIDLAYVAAGILGGAISFGHHVWDHAAGVALVRGAGGVVTDLAGDPWTIESRSALAAAPEVHEELLTIIDSVGVPKEYL